MWTAFFGHMKSGYPLGEKMGPRKYNGLWFNQKYNHLTRQSLIKISYQAARTKNTFILPNLQFSQRGFCLVNR